MRSPRRLSALLLLAAAAACSDQEIPDAPTAPGTAEVPSVEHARSGRAERVRLERLARRIARAMQDSAFRAEVKTAVDQSTFRERKIHFERFLRGKSGRRLAEVARLNQERDADLTDDLEGAPALELYLPVEAHRQRWRGDTDVLVATALEDHATPVAFDVRGRRHLLDPRTPPATPVIAVVPQETDFDASAAAICNIDTCFGDGGGGSGVAPTPGLYLTYASYKDDFEGWLKGSPEFEVHMLGQAGNSDSLTSYQCAGEHASGDYQFDQNSRVWRGNVLLFSQTQLDRYKAQHPGQSLRVFVVEDDDTACQIKTDPDRFKRLVTAVNSAYGLWTGGRDATVGLQRTWQRAQSLWTIWKSLASFIKTNDELVGNAVESAVTGEYYSGANWVVKGEKNVTNGWINLQMR